MPFSKQQIIEIKDILVSTINETLTQNRELIQTIAAAVVQQIKSEIDDRIKTIEKSVCNLTKESKVWREKLNTMEQRQKRNNLRIYGIKEDMNKSLSDHVISNLNKKCKLKLEVSDLEFIYRVKGKDGNNKNKEPILMCFKNYSCKRAIMANKSKFKNSGIFVADDLTWANSILLKRAKEKYGKNNVWTLDGTIFFDNGNGKERFKDSEDLEMHE